MTKLEELGKLIEQVQHFQQLRDQQEESLKRTEEMIATLVEDDIPALMDSLGINKIDTDDGWEIRVEDRYYPDLDNGNKDAAFAWLRDNNHDAIIKNVVSVSFDKGDDKVAVDLAQSLTDDGFPVTLKETVHHQTLKGFVNEQKKLGSDIPDDAFGIYHKREAKMKRKNQ